MSDNNRKPFTTTSRGRVTLQTSTKLCPFCNNYDQNGTFFLSKVSRIHVDIALVNEEENMNFTYVCMNCGFEAKFQND